MKRVMALGLIALCGFCGTASADEIVVAAASSLTNAFKHLVRDYETHDPTAKVLTSFAASDVLQRQVVNGAPVDIFASADQLAMDKAVQGGAVIEADRRNFARNDVVLVVPADDRHHIQSLEDLQAANITRIGIGNPETVPAGRYTRAALQEAAKWDELKHRLVLGQNVRQVLDYVARGEVDAGFVFATDAALMPDRVRVVQSLASPIPVLYSIALVNRQNRNPNAIRFLDYILSEQGQAVLEEYGFSAL